MRCTHPRTGGSNPSLSAIIWNARFGHFCFNETARQKLAFVRAGAVKQIVCDVGTHSK